MGGVSPTTCNARGPALSRCRTRPEDLYGPTNALAGTRKPDPRVAEAAARWRALGVALAEAGDSLLTGGWSGVDCSVADAYGSVAPRR
jgi:hypothetical protein